MRFLNIVMANTLTLGMLSAAPITYTFIGVGSGIANGIPFSNRTVTFSLTTDTSRGDGTPQGNGLFSISGVGQGIYPESYVVAGPQYVGFDISTTTPAFVTSPVLSTYDLRNTIGPVISNSAWGPNGEVGFPVPSPSLGRVVLTSAVTYTFSATRAIPEPGSFALVLIGVAGLIYRAAKCRAAGNK